MAIHTYLQVYTRDAQNYTETFEIQINDAAFGDTTLPTEAKIKAVINAIFASNKLSSQKVDGWGVLVKQDSNVGATGGLGDSATSIAARTRSGLSSILVHPKVRIPGLLKSNVVFSEVDENVILTTAGHWTGARAALADAEIAFAYDDGAAIPENEIFGEATAFNGVRGAKKLR